MDKKEKVGIEERLLNNNIYRAIMSLLWPYQRNELLWDRKTPIEFCTLATILYSVARISELIPIAKTHILEISICFCVCVFAARVAYSYWYLLRYTYDEVVPPLSGSWHSDNEFVKIDFVDEVEILEYATPGKMLGCLTILLFAHSTNPALARCAQLIELGIGIICGLLLLDWILIYFGDLQIAINPDKYEDETIEMIDSQDTEPRFDWEQFSAFGVEENGGVKIVIFIDLEKSDKVNQEFFAKVLAEAHKMAENKSPESTRPES